MKKYAALLTICVLLFPAAFAETYRYGSPRDNRPAPAAAQPMQTQDMSNNMAVRYQNSSTSYFWGGLGFSGGGVGFGAEYEYMLDNDFSTGALVRIYTGGKMGTVESKTVGGFVRAHFPHRSFDFYISPGLAFSAVDTDYGSAKTTLTPVFAMGLMYAFTQNIAGGVENLKIISFTGDYRGTLIDDWMMKVRISF